MVKLKKLLSKKIKEDQKDLVDKSEEEMSEGYFLAENQVNNSQVNKSNNQNNQEWLDDNLEGQLSVDVFQDKDSVIIKSTIAGVKPEDIDISINNDLITIKGKREQEKTINQKDYFYQECYWGNFSRSIILPVEVKPEVANAELKNGILTITLPKAKPSKAISVKVKS